MKKKMNPRVCLRKLLCCLLILGMLPLSALPAFADGDFTRSLSVTDITVTAGGNTTYTHQPLR